ncbi:MAG: hypothetical protein ABIY51_16350 [Ferruginibacter sp.]
MKKKWKYFLQRILVNKISYAIFSPMIFFSERIKASRSDYINREIKETSEKIAENIFDSKIVLHGPFKGMVYAKARGQGSSYYAKLLGSYEKEIHPFIFTAFDNLYVSIINIGCDDGYYAIGLASHFKNIPVHAFDTNPKALWNAKHLAAENNVETYLHFSGTFTNSMTNDFSKGRSLFIVDCEGDEINIFTKTNAANFQTSDLLIELHLHLNPSAVFYFTSLFSASHHIEIVDSVPDHLKAMHYNYPEIKDLDYKTRLFIVEEREVFMQWIFLTAKNPCLE